MWIALCWRKSLKLRQMRIRVRTKNGRDPANIRTIALPGRGRQTLPVKHILALDQGTTSSRAIVFDHGGRIVASAQREFRQLFPQPGRVEHDALEIWTTQLGVARQALRKAGLTGKDIAAIGITNQRET